MGEKGNDTWSLFQCIERHEDCLKIKCSLFNTEFIVSRNGYEKANCPTKFVFKRLLDWLHESQEFETTPTFSSQTFWDINHPLAVRLHYAIGEMIALDNEPLSVVEKRGFQRLMGKTSPSYKIPSRKYLTKTILPDIYNRVTEKVKIILSKVKWMSLTSDLWTCTETHFSFISLTAHWLAENFERQSAALNIQVFRGSHTGVAISDKLTEILLYWGIDKITVHLLLRDNAGNMAKGCRLCDIASEACVIHTLQLVIKSAFNMNKDIRRLLSKCKKISKYFHKSSPANAKLVQIQKDLNLVVKKLKQDVSTRWNSTFYLMERFLELENCLDLFAAAEDDDSKTLTCAEWELLEELTNLLQPFEEVTKSFSYNESCISEVIPTINTLKLCLSKQQVSPTLSPFKRTLEVELETRFQDLESNMNFIMATFLDPRFKTVFFSKNCFEDIQECIRISLTETSSDEDYDNATISIPKEADTENLYDSFQEILSNSQSEGLATERIIATEIELYMRQSLISRKSSPSKWWEKMRGIFPNISQLVYLYLSAPSSSIYSERIFSESGNISDDKRKNLLPKNLELLTFLHHNLPLVNYNY